MVILSAPLLLLGALAAALVLYHIARTFARRRRSSDLGQNVTLNPIKKYEAPLLMERGEKGTKENLEYQQYQVTLRPGYTMAQHKIATGFLTDHYIQGVVDEMFVQDHVIYFAKHIDDDKLAAIRADPGVAMVGFVPKIFLVR